MENTLVQQSAAFVQALFEQHPNHQLFFHDFGHTQAVVATVQKMTQAMELSTQQQQLLQIAAWFHDVGYLYTYQQHEAKSIAIARQFLTKKLSDEQLKWITDSIAATELGVEPTSEQAAILKDADLAYGVTHHFRERGPLLRKEWEIHKDKHLTNAEWELLQYNFLQNVKFWSAYGQQHFAPIVERNRISQADLIKKT